MSVNKKCSGFELQTEFVLILWLTCCTTTAVNKRVEELGVHPFPGSSPVKFGQETPDFAEPIKNVTVAIGREAVLSCSVTDLNHYKVGWLKADDQTILSLHTRVITHNPRVSVSHDDALKTWQLRIRQLKESDRGCYMCQINTSQMKKQLGCIDVQVPPDIDDAGTSGDVTVSEGENATLSCSAVGHPEPRIMWRREDGGHIMVQLATNEVQKMDTFAGPVLKLVRVDYRQMGHYLCIASNDVPPAVSKRISLFVEFAPRVQAHRVLIGTPIESTVRLKCEVQAYPNAHNYWIKDSDEMLLNSIKHTTSEKQNGFSVVMTLTIHNVSQSDYVGYTCVASNMKGKTDAQVRLYEIRLTTTSTTTTTTTTEATTTTTESPTTESNIILEIASNVRSTFRSPFLSADTIGTGRPKDEELTDWMYPSVAPAPLELETLSRAGPRTAIVSRCLLALFLILCVLR